MAGGHIETLKGEIFPFHLVIGLADKANFLENSADFFNGISDQVEAAVGILCSGDSDINRFLLGWLLCDLNPFLIQGLNEHGLDFIKLLTKGLFLRIGPVF